jgi:hypothetical protein
MPTSPYTFDNLASLTVTIGGVDVTTHIDAGDFVLNNVASGQVSTCSFTLTQATGMVADTWQEIIVRAGTTKIFGGYVMTVDIDPDDILGVTKKISASDYSVRLRKIIISATYANKTDVQIIENIFQTYLGSWTRSFNCTPTTFGSISFTDKPIIDILNTITNMTGVAWYVSPDKWLCYYDPPPSSPPFDISDTPNYSTTFPAEAITKARDGTSLINRVIINGGLIPDSDQYLYAAGNNQFTKIYLDYPVAPPSGSLVIQVWRNDGSDTVPSWTALTVKAGGFDKLEAANEVLYYEQEKYLEQAGTWPMRAQAVRVYGGPKKQFSKTYTDAASYAKYGMYFDMVINDSDITTVALADQRAAAELGKYADEIISGSFTVRQPGLSAGQLIQITDARLNFGTSHYLIQRAATTIGANSIVQTKCTVGPYKKELIDLLIELSKEKSLKALQETDIQKIIDIDNISFGSGNSFAHTCSGTNLIVFLAVQSDRSGSSVGSPKYNNVAMTELYKIEGTGGYYFYVYYLVNPATGTHNFTWTGGYDCTGVGASYTGVDTSDPLEAPLSHHQSSDNVDYLIILRPTNVVGDWTIGFCTAFNLAADTGNLRVSTVKVMLTDRNLGDGGELSFQVNG